MKVGEQNVIQYRFYEKETCSNKTVQKRRAMEENSKNQILANDLVRRMCKSMELMEKDESRKVVEDYAKKLLNSGYSVEHVRRIIVNGIRGYEGRRRRCRTKSCETWAWPSSRSDCRRAATPRIVYILSYCATSGAWRRTTPTPYI